MDPRYDDAPITFDSFWALPFAAPPIGGFINIIHQNDYALKAITTIHKNLMEIVIWQSDHSNKFGTKDILYL